MIISAFNVHRCFPVLKFQFQWQSINNQSATAQLINSSEAFFFSAPLANFEAERIFDNVPGHFQSTDRRRNRTFD